MFSLTEIKVCCIHIFVIFVCRYVSLVQEVLRSVCKTEESLRRLKNRNLTNNDDSLAQTNGDATSDEAKIREQIKLDVGHFIREVG